MSQSVKITFVHMIFSPIYVAPYESLSLGMESKVGDRFPLTIYTWLGLIVCKYLEGNVKRTLERELNVPEHADVKLNGSDEHFAVLPAML